MSKKSFITLGIESSCDETGIGLYSSDQGLLTHKLFSQVDLHAEYGGVVPELASRDHIQRALPLIRETLDDSNIKLEELTGIAYTAGPGLSGALLVGGSIAQSLAWGLENSCYRCSPHGGSFVGATFRFITAKISICGTSSFRRAYLLVEVVGIGEYKILGQSLDDAVGEAFDKTAKILGLGYPGGPALALLATKGVEGRFDFPRPMIDRPGLDFSFSGLKTFARNTFINFPKEKASIAKAFEVAATDTLMIKCRRALEQTGFSTLVVAGGVSANLALRQTLNDMAKKLNIDVHYPAPEFCTDNGAMIALAGHYRLLSGQSKRSL